MTGNALWRVLSKALRVARRRKIKIAIMGGVATSIYSPPRATFDLDGIAGVGKGGIKNFLSDLRQEGFTYDKKHPVKSIQGLSFITLYFARHKIYLDLFLAESDFQKLILERTHSVRTGKLRLDIISPEDLILVKLLSGRPRDTEDVRQILVANSEELDFAYLRSWAQKLKVAVFLEDEMRSLRIKTGDG